MKKIADCILAFLFFAFACVYSWNAQAWSTAEVSVHQTAGAQSIQSSVMTRVTYNAVDINVGNTWNATTNQWCPGVTGSADIEAAVLWTTVTGANPKRIPDQANHEIFITVTNGPSSSIGTYLWGEHRSFSGVANQGSSIHRQSLYVDNANNCYSIGVFQISGSSLDITDTWPQVTWASFRINP